ncbi:MAG: alpha/beta hydrolase [Woeseiaceae bacterium]|nr:alpha/beta hydrolase [Woeseiaceae bacterium]
MNDTSFPEPTLLAVNDVRLAVHEQGDGDPVILLHGFPELAFSWRFQMPALAAAGFRAIAPDQRGYGLSSCPDAVGEYTIQKLIADINGLLDALGLESARFVGHDWGAILLWQYALMNSDRVDEMVVLNIPFYPRPPVDPITIFRHRHGNHFYIVDFQDSSAADREFAADPSHFINNMMRRGQITREAYERLPAQQRVLSLRATMAKASSGGTPLLSDEELDYFADAFARSGFTGGINWYRNMEHNWVSTADVEQRIRTRTLFIGARDDVVIPLGDIESMREHVDDLRIEMLAPCGHWSQQERPDDVNQLILDFFSHGAGR